MPERTDEEIAIAIQKGDIQAFGVLVERYEAKMLLDGTGPKIVFLAASTTVSNIQIRPAPIASPTK